MRGALITGTLIGRLTVLHPIEKEGDKRKYYQCICSCGNSVIVRKDHLDVTHTTSCGCLRAERLAVAITKHGDSRCRIYRIWMNIKQRCTNPKNNGYKYYGFKGVDICKEWLSYESFKKRAVAGGYDSSLTIDRVDSARGYEPSNCRWITQRENTIRAHIGTHPIRKDSTKKEGLSERC